MNNDREADELLNQLRKLQPVAVTMDPRKIFYLAGYAAAIAEHRPSRSLRPLLAASLLFTIVGIPASFYAGKKAAADRELVAQVERDRRIGPEDVIVNGNSSTPHLFNDWSETRPEPVGLTQSNSQSSMMLSIRHASQAFQQGNEFAQRFDRPINASAIANDRDSLIEAKPLFLRSIQNPSFLLEATK